MRTKTMAKQFVQVTDTSKRVWIVNLSNVGYLRQNESDWEVGIAGCDKLLEVDSDNSKKLFSEMPGVET
jgi:hypothetical protein